MTDDGGVLENLPNSRPGRRSAKRDRPAKTAARAAAKAEAGGKAAAKAPRTPKTSPPKRTAEREVQAGATSGDPVVAVVRGAAGIAVTGVKVAGAVTHELLRRLPRP